jgi:hypothetical protein
MVNRELEVSVHFTPYFLGSTYVRCFQVQNFNFTHKFVMLRLMDITVKVVSRGAVCITVEVFQR